MHHGDAGGGHIVYCNRRRGTQLGRIEGEIVERAGDLVICTGYEKRAGGEVLAVGIEGFLCSLDLRAFQLVDHGEQRRLAGVVDGDDGTGAIQFARERRGVVDRLHCGFEDGTVADARDLQVEKMCE